MLENFKDGIKTSLITVDLEDAPPYEALSYVWGDVTDLKTVQLTEHTCFITTNLFNALGNIRNSNIERLIWVDALLHQSIRHP
jgi:hypothetical protein